MGFLLHLRLYSIKNIIMKKTLLALFLLTGLFFFTPLAAQIHFGIRGGLNLANNDITAVSINSAMSQDSYTGFFFGPMFEATLPLIGLAVDLSALYSQSGMKLSDSENMREQYFSIPLSLKYCLGLGDMIAVFVAAGPQLDFNVGTTERYIQSGSDPVQEYIMNKSVYSFNVGVGMKLINHIQVAVDFNLPLGDKGTYGVYADGTNLDNYNNAVKQGEEAIKASVLKVSATYIF